MKKNSTFKIILSFWLILSLVLSSSCSANKSKKTDLFEIAINTAGIDTLADLPSKSLGYGPFEDYHMLHSNPTEAAKYPAEFSDYATDIQADTAKLDAFLEQTTSRNGFQADLSEYTALPGEKDLKKAMTALFSVAGEDSGLQDAIDATAEIQKEIKKPLAQFLIASAKAYQLIKKATENLDSDELSSLSNFTFCPPATALSLIYDMDNAYLAHEETDENMMLAAGIIMAKASSKLCQELRSGHALTKSDSTLTIFTPLGEIILGSTQNDEYYSTEALLLIEPAGNDFYQDEIAYGHREGQPISISIDLCGNDTYSADETANGSQGCGIGGIGMLFDLEGNDTYSAVHKAQGFSLLGVGLLFDGNGNDQYDAEVSAQASAHYGIGGLFDIGGDDSYHAYAYAQSSAGNRAMTFLVDQAGNDDYTVEPFIQPGYEALEYDILPDVNGNWSQGCAMGQRNLSYNGERGISGGIAGLIDLDGNDRYRGGIWVQGVGYWSGIGFLQDQGGNDIYSSKYYSQASVAHYGIGILIDESGNDQHLILQETIQSGQGASLGFTWDRGVAMFINDGGNDRYVNDKISCGAADSAYDPKGNKNQDQTYAFFIDTEGNDIYSDSRYGAYGFGRGGFFIDAAGQDSYEKNHTQNNAIVNNDDTQGGVFLDYTPQAEEEPYVSFWK